MGGKAVYLPTCLLTASQKASKDKCPRRMRKKEGHDNYVNGFRTKTYHFQLLVRQLRFKGKDIKYILEEKDVCAML